MHHFLRRINYLKKVETLKSLATRINSKKFNQGMEISKKLKFVYCNLEEGQVSKFLDKTLHSWDKTMSANDLKIGVKEATLPDILYEIRQDIFKSS